MCIDLNWLCLHGMHIEQILIECEMNQSTFGGSLNAKCKWIG